MILNFIGLVLIMLNVESVDTISIYLEIGSFVILLSDGLLRLLMIEMLAFLFKSVYHCNRKIILLLKSLVIGVYGILYYLLR